MTKTGKSSEVVDRRQRVGFDKEMASFATTGRPPRPAAAARSCRRHGRDPGGRLHAGVRHYRASGVGGESMIRIVLADDHSLVRTGLSQLLDAQPDIEVVGLASDGREALQLARGLTPDVVLMDLQMPIVDGITAIGILAASNPEIAVIALTTFQEPQQVTAALAAGARGYLVKDVEPEVLGRGNPRRHQWWCPTQPFGGGPAHPQRVDPAELWCNADATRAADPATHRRWTEQQADRTRARDQREDREVALRPAVPANQRVGPHPGSGVGDQASSARRRVTGWPGSECLQLTRWYANTPMQALVTRNDHLPADSPAGRCFRSRRSRRRPPRRAGGPASWWRMPGSATLAALPTYRPR